METLFAALLMTAQAATLGGVTLPNTMDVAGKKLVLNGMGLREATIFKVDVYAAGLYLEKASSNADEILASPGVKHLPMQFVREVEAKKIRGAWTEGYEKTCADKCEAMKPSLEKLNAAMADMNKGDSMAFTFYKDKLVADVKGTKTEI